MNKKIIHLNQILRVARTHFSDKYPNPLLTTIMFIVNPAKDKLFLVKKAGDDKWCLPEPMAIVGKDYEESSVDELKNLGLLNSLINLELIGLESDPDRADRYTYSPVVKAVVEDIKGRDVLPGGIHTEGKFFDLSSINIDQIDSSYQAIVRRYISGEKVSVFGKRELLLTGKEGQEREVLIPYSPEKRSITKETHQARINGDMRLTQPLLDISAILEIYDGDIYKGIAVGKRAQGSGKNQWGNFGGHVSGGEDAVYALTREICEEAGFDDIEVLDLQGIRETPNKHYPINYWSTFLTARTTMEQLKQASPDGKETSEIRVITCLEELKAFARTEQIAWDFYTILTEYFMKREQKEYPLGLVSIDPPEAFNLDEVIPNVFGNYRLSQNRQTFIRAAMGILFQEIIENKKNYLYRYHYDDYIFALRSPLQHFLTKQLMAAMKANSVDAIYPRFMLLGDQDVFDTYVLADYVINLPPGAREEHNIVYSHARDEGTDETLAKMQADRHIIEKYGLFRQTKDKASGTWKYETWFWVFGTDTTIRLNKEKVPKLADGEQALLYSLYHSLTFVYKDRSANSFVLLNSAMLPEESGLIPSSSNVCAHVDGVPIPAAWLTEKAGQTVYEILSGDVADINASLQTVSRQLLKHLESHISSIAYIGRLSEPDKEELIRRLSYEVYKILVVSKMIEALNTSSGNH